MTNADKFKAVFGMYSEEFWAKPEQDMLSWINSEYQEPKSKVTVQSVNWIPVTERSPDMHVEVLVCIEDYGETELGFATVAVFDGSGWLEAWGRKTYLTAVTHWMPLPKPPKGDNP